MLNGKLEWTAVPHSAFYKVDETAGRPGQVLRLSRDKTALEFVDPSAPSGNVRLSDDAGAREIDDAPLHLAAFDGSIDRIKRVPVLLPPTMPSSSPSHLVGTDSRHFRKMKNPIGPAPPISTVSEDYIVLYEETTGILHRDKLPAPKQLPALLTSGRGGVASWVSAADRCIVRRRDVFDLGNLTTITNVGPAEEPAHAVTYGQAAQCLGFESYGDTIDARGIAVAEVGDPIEGGDLISETYATNAFRGPRMDNGRYSAEGKRIANLKISEIVADDDVPTKGYVDEAAARAIQEIHFSLDNDVKFNACQGRAEYYTVTHDCLLNYIQVDGEDTNNDCKIYLETTAVTVDYDKKGGRLLTRFPRVAMRAGDTIRMRTDPLYPGWIFATLHLHYSIF